MNPNDEQNSKLIKRPKQHEECDGLWGSDEEKLPVIQGFDEDEYKMDHPRRGKAIIFNHYKYLDELKLEREGSEKDVERLKEELEALGFEVDIQPDKTCKQIQEKLEQVSKEDHTDADCLIVVAMSHGKRLHPEKRFKKDDDCKKFSRQEMLAYDKGYDENELFKFFEGDKCRSLRGKPKLFFIQACRGDKDDKKKSASSKVLTAKSHKTNEEQEISPEIKYSEHLLPNATDFFIFRATVDGTFANRNTVLGAHFIQILCDELKENRQKGENALDLESLSINVRRKMVKEEKSQIPCVHTTLIRKLYLRVPKDDSK